VGFTLLELPVLRPLGYNPPKPFILLLSFIATAAFQHPSASGIVQASLPTPFNLSIVQHTSTSQPSSVLMASNCIEDMTAIPPSSLKKTAIFKTEVVDTLKDSAQVTNKKPFLFLAILIVGTFCGPIFPLASVDYDSGDSLPLLSITFITIGASMWTWGSFAMWSHLNPNQHSSTQAKLVVAVLLVTGCFLFFQIRVDRNTTGAINTLQLA
jgi:hypothetical protein